MLSVVSAVLLLPFLLQSAHAVRVRRLLLQYPFPVKDSIMWMADHVDLILVFFDPVSDPAAAAAAVVQ
jgi:hypothetical protein